MVNDNRKFVLITGHDARSKRKANIHFIARELVSRGQVRMISVGFSWLSNIRGRDPRIGLEDVANSAQLADGIESYLWRTWFHPFNPRWSPLYRFSRLAFSTYVDCLPKEPISWVQQADVILVESGIGAAFLGRVLALRKEGAQVIYIASDDVETIDCDPFISEQVNEQGAALDGIRLPSKVLASAFPVGSTVNYIPHGIDVRLGGEVGPNPYSDDKAAVSVGSMLFDADFFWRAVDLVPEIDFYVIGSGVKARDLPPSIHFYDEMPFTETLPYVKHARFGVAPYKPARLPYYLADTSMKLLQYEYFGLAAVCPSFAVGGYDGSRFGYTPGDSGSIGSALRLAMSRKPVLKRRFLSWSDVVDRILSPSEYLDTRI